MKRSTIYKAHIYYTGVGYAYTIREAVKELTDSISNTSDTVLYIHIPSKQYRTEQLAKSASKRAIKRLVERDKE